MGRRARRAMRASGARAESDLAFVDNLKTLM